jgi:lipoyl(octanoyl) transferase
VEVVYLGPQPQDYRATWDLQRDIHAAVVCGDRPDTLLLLEHEPVYTAGRRTESGDLPIDGTPVIEVDRGGRITWHGPGQLVGYPIIRLAEPLAVVDHVRRLERLLMAACADLGVATIQVPGRSGVWVDADAVRPQRKIAAIGVRVSQGVTLHGFALNCDNSLAAFDAMVPCGISDAGVTTITIERDTPVSVSEALPIVEAHARVYLAGLTPTA